MAPGSCSTCQSFCVNILANSIEKLDKLACTQGPARRSHVGSNKAFIKAYTSFEASTPPFVPLPAKNLFTKFIKVFIETTQAQNQEQLESQKQLLKVKTPETYSKKIYIDCYYFCQQYEDYFEILDAKGMNCTSFAAIFLYGSVSLKWA